VARRLQVLIRLVPLLLMLGQLAVVVWMVRIHKRRQLDDHQRMQQAVAHATGAVPDEFARDERLLEKQSSWWSATVTVGVLVGAAAGYWITRIFWPRVPAWTFLAIALLLHALVTLGQSLVKRTPKPWDPIEPGGPRFDWGPTRRAVPASLAVFILMNVGAFPRWMGDPVVWLINGFVAVMWYSVLEQKFVLWAIRRGDYEGALKVVRLFHFYNPEGGAAQQRIGHILLLAGRFREAEETLRRAVAGLRSRAAQAHALEFLGDALLEQGRYDEAQRSYEAALAAAPGFRRPYRGMAELALRQGLDRARALEHVENIVGPKGPSWNRWTVNGQAADDYWSLRAWALAELGRGAEVPHAVAEAIRKTNAKSGPDLAATYRRLGLAMRAMDRQAEAEEYLKKASAVDPHGRWSALAKAALGERSAWSV
jgi:tetratricopeptide (TPR) repeat protein